jgi:hypothetical protein
MSEQSLGASPPGWIWRGRIFPLRNSPIPRGENRGKAHKADWQDRGRARSPGPRGSGETLWIVRPILTWVVNKAVKEFLDQPTSTLIALPRTRMVNQAVVKFLEQEERPE